MPVLAWFIFCTLIWRGVRLPCNWVNTEGTNMYEDFIIPRWLSWRGVSFRVDLVDRSLTWCWLSWRGMRLCVNWFTAECSKIRISRQSQEQNRKNSKELLFGLFMFYQCKKLEQEFYLPRINIVKKEKRETHSRQHTVRLNSNINSEVKTTTCLFRIMPRQAFHQKL